MCFCDKKRNCIPFYEVHCLVSHPLSQVLRIEWLLHNIVVLHQNTIEARYDHDESDDQRRERHRRGKQRHKKPSADGDDADEVEQGRGRTDGGECPIR